MIQLNKLALSFEAEMIAQQSLLGKYAFAQSCLESNYFKSTLSVRENNAWGIKFVGQFDYKGVEYPTVEYRPDGSSYKTRASFCTWDNVTDAVRAYYSLVERRYRDAWKARRPEDYFAGMKRWATDARYPQLCLSVYDRIYP